MNISVLRRGLTRHNHPLKGCMNFSSSSDSRDPNLSIMRQSMDKLLGREPTKFVSFFDEVDRKMSKNRNHQIGIKSIPLYGNELKSKSGEETSSRMPLSTTEYILEKGPFVSEPIHNRPRPLGFDSANAYDKDLFDQYKDVIVEHIMANPKFHNKAKNVPEYQTVCDWLLLDYTQVEYTLPLLHGADIINHETNRNTTCNLFRDQLKDQQDKFINFIRFTPDRISLLTATLTALSRYCAKRNQIVPLMVGWEKIKEAGIVLSEEEASTFLYVFGNSSALYSSMLLGSSRLGDLLVQNYGSFSSHRTSSVSEILTGSKFDASRLLGNESSTSKESKETNIPAEVATYHDLLYKPTERSISIRVKALVAKGDAHGAQTLLDLFPANDEARLRTYLPILKLHCEQGDVTAALTLFQKMRSIPTVHLESENYILIIATIAEHGYFQPNSPPLNVNSMSGMVTNGVVLSGTKLLDFLLTQMADDVLEITSASARRLYNSLLRGFKGSSSVQNLSALHSFTNMRHENHPAHPNEFVVSRVAINEKTATCPRTSVKLPLILLNDEQKHQLRESIFKLSNEQHQNYVVKKPIINFASDELKSFAKYLDSRLGKPFTVIVDGANVAYYMQNFDYGKFNWFQVQFMVKELIKLNENPLVIVPSKYCRPSFHNTTGTSTTKQVLQPKEKMVINSLLESGRLYRVPANVYDDYHWILSSISEQRASRKDLKLDVQADDPQGRWPGTRPMIITNDQLKDLKIEMMEPRLFRRWFSSHIVNYTFTAFVDDQCADDDICFSPADFFSREIQCNTSGECTTWHIPVSDWELNDRLCIRLPND